MGPVQGGEKPINWLKKCIKLHVTQCTSSTLNWNLNELLLANYIVKCDHVIQVPPKFVAVVRSSHVIKIVDEQPVLIIRNPDIIQPGSKRNMIVTRTRAINISELPGLRGLSTDETED